MPCSSTKKAALVCQLHLRLLLQRRSVKLPSKAKSESTPLLWSTTTSDAVKLQHHRRRTRLILRLDPQHPRLPLLHRPRPDLRLLRNILPTDDRTLIDPDFARDCIVGLSDGLMFPLPSLPVSPPQALPSSLSSLVGRARFGRHLDGDWRIFVGTGRVESLCVQQRSTQQRVERSCGSEVQRQVHEILKGYGIAEGSSAQIAAELTAQEKARREMEQLAVQHTVQEADEGSSVASQSLTALPAHKRNVDGDESLKARISNQPV